MDLPGCPGSQHAMVNKYGAWPLRNDFLWSYPRGFEKDGTTVRTLQGIERGRSSDGIARAMSWQFQVLTSDLSHPDYRRLRVIFCVGLSTDWNAVWHPAAKHEAKQNQSGAEQEHRPRFRSRKSVKGCTRESGRARAQR